MLHGLILGLALATAPTAEISPSIADLSKPAEITSISISPDGKTLALLAPFGPKGSVVLFMDSATLKPTTGFKDEGTLSIGDIFWLSNERIAAYTVRKFGGFAEPVRTGEILAVNADGSGNTILYGSRGSPTIGTRITQKAGEDGYATLIDPRLDDEEFALITVDEFKRDGDFTQLQRVNKRTGRTIPEVRAPIINAGFLVNNQGEAVISYGEDLKFHSKVYRRVGKEWVLWLDEAEVGQDMTPLALSDDASEVLLLRTRDQGPDELIAVAFEDAAERVIYQGKHSSPSGLLFSADRRRLLAVITADGDFGVHFVEADSREAKIIRGLQKHFPGQFVRPVSFSLDGNVAIFMVSSGANSGEYYVFDAKKKAARFLFPRDSWLNPEDMATVKPIQLKSRDGLDLHGYLTLPPKREAKNLPLVVMPHGGPHGVRDFPNYDPWAQVLATRGYAVLKVNFRGSGGYGQAFEAKGYGQWGQAMIDDIADATRWAIAEGYADKDRIAIAGASYGGYAALMSGAREPELYRAVISYVGVSDLEWMYSKGDIQRSRRGENALERFLGTDKSALKANSPVNLALQFKAPVLILHGAEDFRVPVEHGRAMKKALEKAGKNVEYFEAATEGHGFYLPKNVEKGHQLMLDFLAEHL